jgi:hypothetical protein
MVYKLLLPLWLSYSLYYQCLRFVLKEQAMAHGFSAACFFQKTEGTTYVRTIPKAEQELAHARGLYCLHVVLTVFAFENTVIASIPRLSCRDGPPEACI